MFEELKKLYDICFNDGKSYTDYVFEHKYTQENVLYLRENGNIVSELFYVNKKISLRGIVVDCPYICGVCTLPEYRGRGYASALLEKISRLLKEKGYELCALYPFSHAFYEKRGFVTCTMAESYTVKYAGNGVKTRQGGIEDVPLLGKLYREFMKGKNCYCYRDAQETLSKYGEMTSSGKCVIIYENNTAVGYAYYDQNEIEEYCAPLEYIDRVEELSEKKVYLPEGSAKGQKEPYLMLKLLDRQKFEERFCGGASLGGLSDSQTLYAVTGAWKSLKISLSEAVKNKFSQMTNYVFDKY